jgi:AraC-like DNA-binding protein/predicted nucleic acid-binding Zn ribbon protein
MMTNTAVPNAVDVLPKRLLSKLQRYCSGSIYVPAQRTQAQMNMARVQLLHSRGWKPTEIADAAEMSTKQVRHIIKQIESGGISSSPHYKVYDTVPQEIVEAVQQYVSGPIYVPGKASKSECRRSLVQRLLSRGIPISEVAKRSGLSERRVRQIRQAEPDLCIKPRKEKPEDRFGDGVIIDPDYTPPKRCSVCGLPVGPYEDECELCRYQSETRRDRDSDTITIDYVPFAIIDRRF